MKCQGWALDALAVRCAASTTRRKTASGTSLSWYSRTAITVRTASQTSFAMGAIVLALCAEMDEPKPAERHYERRISSKHHRAEYQAAKDAPMEHKPRLITSRSVAPNVHGVGNSGRLKSRREIHHTSASDSTV